MRATRARACCALRVASALSAAHSVRNWNSTDLRSRRCCFGGVGVNAPQLVAARLAAVGRTSRGASSDAQRVCAVQCWPQQPSARARARCVLLAQTFVPQTHRRLCACMRASVCVVVVDVGVGVRVRICAADNLRAAARRLFVARAARPVRLQTARLQLNAQT